MNKPVLLVLAAGMGSRLGGLKQIEPLGPNGEIIIDHSVYDAMKAGFEKVVFVVKPELLEIFKEQIGKRALKYMEVDYALQDVSCLPDGMKAPCGRSKPWGTGHAVWCAADKIDGPFGVINADDFYGRDAYMRLYGFLTKDVGEKHMCMVGFPLKNTLTENGSVSRGICEIQNGKLMSVTERTKIYSGENGIFYTENGVDTPIRGDSIASMNVWGLSSSVFEKMGREFGDFISRLTPENENKAEFYLPTFVDGLIKEGLAEVNVLETTAKWYGVTYKEDKDSVKKALADMYDEGLYPNLLQM